MSKVVDFQTFKAIRDSGKALDDLEALAFSVEDMIACAEEELTGEELTTYLTGLYEDLRPLMEVLEEMQ